jgi:hypothetical protein
MGKERSINKPRGLKASSKVKCQGCGKLYKETGYHWHGDFCGYCSEDCFKQNGG